MAEPIASCVASLSLVPVKPGDDKPTQKPSRLSNEQKEAFSLSPRLKEIIVGSALGDLNIRIQNVNASLRFIQGVIHEDYLNWLYEEFKDFCPKQPIICNPQPHKKTGKVYSSIRFTTYSLPCFNEYYNLFYLDGRKIVPKNIGELLTAVGLAILIADDGNFNKKSQRVTLNTQGFTEAQVNLLAKTLNDKWDLKCVVYQTGEGYVISIPRKSLPILQDLLKDIMPPMMLYKIGL